MRHALRSSFAAAVLTGLLLASPLARANAAGPTEATPSQLREATRHFKAGKHDLDRKRWQSAVSELRASLDIVDSPNARLELARALAGDGKLAEAWNEYDLTAAGAAKLVGHEPKYKATGEAATTERGALEARLAFVVVSVDHAPPETVLSVGGRPVPRDRDSASTKVLVEPGRVEIVVQSEGKELARATVTAAVGTKTPVALDALPPPAPVAIAPPVTTAPITPEPAPGVVDDRVSSPLPTEVPASPPRPSKLRFLVWPAAGLAVAGLATFAVAGVMSTSTYNDLENKCHGPCPPGNTGEISSGRTQQTVANVGLVVGIAGAAAAGVLFFVSRPRAAAPAPSAGLLVGPGWLGVGGSL